MTNLPALTDCKPGFSATEFNVVIALPSLANKIGSIIIPEKKAEADQAALMRGLVVDIAPMAGDGVWPQAGKARPQVGDTVVFAKYGGVLIDGDDGREYRILKDKDVIAVHDRKEP